jgi:hypothetical protein
MPYVVGNLGSGWFLTRAVHVDILDGIFEIEKNNIYCFLHKSKNS